MDKQGHIDLERISSSIETLSSIENVINIVNLSDNFDDIEKCFRQVNFEHSNCLSYKESLDTIYQDLEFIKKRINELSDALRKTKANYTNITTFSEEEIKEFSSLYKTSDSGKELAKLVGTENTFSLKDLATNLEGTNNNVTTIPAPTPETTPMYEQQSEPINTIPIGIAIGATGIAGSIGAVIIDDMYGGKKSGKYKNRKKRISDDELDIDDYNEDDIIEENYDYDQIRKATGAETGSYRAARLTREADRFYGNELDKMELEDDEEYIDEDDDDDYDDF